MKGKTEYTLSRLKVAYYKKTKSRTSLSLCQEYEINRGTPEEYLKQFHENYKNNKEVRHQIILGSILGDGYLQKTPNGTIKYRESHSIKESDYIMWKYMMMGNWTETTTIGNKNRNNNHCNALEFCTSASAHKELLPYFNMTLDDVVSEINIYGLLIFFLDDGWIKVNPDGKSANLNIATGKIPELTILAIKKKFSNYSIELSIVGKRKDIQIKANDSELILAYAEKMFGSIYLDVLQKKLGLIFKLRKEKII